MRKRQTNYIQYMIKVVHENKMATLQKYPQISVSFNYIVKFWKFSFLLPSLKFISKQPLYKDGGESGRIENALSIFISIENLHLFCWDFGKILKV